MSVHIYRLTITYNVAGQFAQNILHYQFEDGGFTNTALAANALATQFDTSNTAGLKAMLPTATKILSYKGRGISMPGGFESVLLLAGPPAGTRTGNVQASAVSPVILLIPTGNAKQRGRVF